VLVEAQAPVEPIRNTPLRPLRRIGVALAAGVGLLAALPAGALTIQPTFVDRTVTAVALATTGAENMGEANGDVGQASLPFDASVHASAPTSSASASASASQQSEIHGYGVFGEGQVAAGFSILEGAADSSASASADSVFQLQFSVDVETLMAVSGVLDTSALLASGSAFAIAEFVDLDTSALLFSHSVIGGESLFFSELVTLLPGVHYELYAAAAADTELFAPGSDSALASYQVRMVPEPGSLGLLLVGIAVMTLRRRRRAVRVLSVVGALLLLDLASPALAQEVETPDSPLQAPIPRAFGTPGSLQVDPGSGSVTDSLPLSLPRSRRAFEPKLSFDYSSAQGQGDLGRGWSFGGFSFIEVDEGDGVPIGTIDGSAVAYRYQLGGAGGELVAVGAGLYRAVTENAYLEFRRIDAGAAGIRWEVRSGDGVVRSFGATVASRIGERRWLLDRETDASGNIITYEYIAYDRQGQSCSSFVTQRCAAYPRAVRYAFHAQHPFASNKLVLEYESRPDLRLSMRLGVAQERSMRLSRVSVFASTCGDVESCPQLARRYELTYAQHALNGESLLERIELVGADDASRVVLRSLEYGTRAPAWVDRDLSIEIPPEVELIDAQQRNRGTVLADVNGDGYQDAIGHSDATSQPYVALGSDAGFTFDADWSASFAAIGVQTSVKSGGYYGADTGVRVVDVDGDGRPDVVVANGTRTEVWLNTGVAWVESDLWSSSLASLPVPGGTAPLALTGRDPVFGLPTYADSGVRLADVNGDGRVDIVQAIRTDNYDLIFDRLQSQTNSRNVYLNTGSGWERNALLSGSLPAPFVIIKLLGGVAYDGTTPVGWELLEANGDGLVDLVNTAERPGNAPQVYLGSPAGWAFDAERSASLLAQPLIESRHNRHGTGLVSIDYNSDGLVDFVRGCWGGLSLADSACDQLPPTRSVLEAWRNTGSGWAPDPVATENMRTAGVILVGGVPTYGPIFFTVDGSCCGKPADMQFGFEPHDLNGDGVVDWLLAPPLGFGFPHAALRAEHRPDAGLLVRSTDALGEVTEIAWESSSRFDNRLTRSSPLDPEIHALPLIQSVATRLTRTDGLGAVAATDFDYQEGAFDGKYRGFAKSTQTDPNGLRRETVHSQDEHLVGRPLVTEAFDAQNRLRARTLASYELRPAEGGLVTQVLLSSNEQRVFDELGGTTHHESLIFNGYDDRLNPLVRYRAPDVEHPGRDSTTTFSWLRNDPAGIWSVPGEIRVYSGAAQLIANTFFTYDGLPPGQVSRGLPTAREDWVQGGQLVRQELQYDAFGNLIALVDRNGNAYGFEYGDPARTYRTRGVDPEGRVVSSEYDPRFGVVTRDVNASGDEQHNEYDAFGRLSKVFLPGDDPAFPSTTYGYSPVGLDADVPCVTGTQPCVAQYFVVNQRERARFSDMLSQRSFFDARGLVYQIETDAAGGTVVVALHGFDDAGNRVAESLPFMPGETPRWRLTERDVLRRPVRVEDPDGLATTYAYVGRQVEVVDRRGVSSFYTRDGDGNITEVNRPVDGVDQITTYGYDESNRIVSVVDALGSETRVAYDHFGRRVRLEDTNLGAFDYAYDGESNLLSLTAPDGGTTRFGYDATGNLVRKTFPDGSQQTFEYGAPGGDPHAVGRLVRVTDAAGTLTQSYDARGNVVEKRRDTTTRRRPGRTYVTAYAYDPMDRVIHVTYPDGFWVVYLYDAGSLAVVGDSSGRVLLDDVQRNAAGQRLTALYGNGAHSTITYDALNRTESVRTWGSSGPDLQNLGFSYDAGHNIIALQDLAGSDSQVFDYDDAGRLVFAQGAYGQEDYVYDPTGGLLRKGALAFAMDPARPQRVTCVGDATLDPTGALCAQNAAAGTAGAMAIAYDGRGNVALKGDRRYVYDAENRLLAVRSADGVQLQENVYDAFGRRVIERKGAFQTLLIDGLYEESETSTARHIFADGKLLATVVAPRAGIQLIAAAPPPESGAGAVDLAGMAGGVGLLAIGWRKPGWRRRGRRELGAVAAEVRRRPGRAGTSLFLLPLYLLALWQPLLQGCVPQTFGQAYYYHANHLGSVEVISDDSGNPVERRFYRPYGEPEDWSGPQLGNEQLSASFDGQRHDAATGLYSMGMRHYDPALGRFLSADVIVSNPADPRTLHRYAFAGGNPVRLADPGGRYFWDDVLDAVVSVWDWTVGATNTLNNAVNSLVSSLPSEVRAALAIYYLVVIVVVAVAVPNPFTIGMAIGAVSAALAHFADGGSADTLLGPVLVGAAIGGATGYGGAKAAAGSKSLATRLAANGHKYLAAGLANATKAAKALASAGQLYKIGVPTAALAGAALAVRHVAVRPGFAGIQAPGEPIRGSVETFGTAGLEFLAPGFEPDPILFRVNGLSTYPLTP
jgi:RHS repeat-associated protein